MQVQFEQEPERLVARPQGRLEAADGTELISAVEQRLDPHTRSVTVDLDALDFVSLGGVRAMLRLGRSLKHDDKQLDFARGGEAVRHALDQAGMGHFFAFEPPLHSTRGDHR